MCQVFFYCEPGHAWRGDLSEWRLFNLIDPVQWPQWATIRVDQEMCMSSAKEIVWKYGASRYDVEEINNGVRLVPVQATVKNTFANIGAGRQANGT